MSVLSQLIVKLIGDDSSLQSTFDKNQKSADTFAAKMEAIGARIAVALPFAAIGAAAFSAAEKFEAANRLIANRTGETGAALKGLEESFKKVYSATAASSEQTSQALALLHQRLGLTGQGLESLTGQFLKVSKQLGVDANQTIPLITRVFGDWGISTDKQSATLRYLQVVSQRTGVDINQLSQQVVFAGAPLRQLGFTFEQSTALIAKFEKEGVNTELVLGGMKAALGKFAAEGLTGADAFRRYVAEIKAADEGHAGLMAVQLVGVKRASDFVAAIREGRYDIDEMVKSISAATKAGGDQSKEMPNWHKQWEIFKHNVEAALLPLGTPMLTALSGVIDSMKVAIPYIGGAAKAFNDLDPAIKIATVSLIAFQLALSSGAIGKVVSMAAAIGSWGAGIVSWGGKAIAAISTLGTVAAKFGPGVTVMVESFAIGAARIAGWAALAFEIYRVANAYWELRKARDGAVEAEKAESQATQELAVRLRQHGVDIRKLDDDYRHGIISYEDYRAGLRKAANENAAAKPVVEDHTGAIEKQTEAVAASIETWRRATMQELIDEDAHGRNTSAIRTMIGAVVDFWEAGQDWGKKLELHAASLDNGSEAALRYALALKVIADELRNMPIKQMDIDVPLSERAKGTALEMILKKGSSVNLRVEANQAKEEAEHILDLWQEGKATQADYERAVDKATEAERRASGEVTVWQKKIDVWGKLAQHAMQDFSRSIADVIVDGANFGEAMIGVVKNIAKSIISTLVEGALRTLAQSLFKIGDQGKGLASIFGSIGGGATSAGTSAAGSVGSAGSGAGGVASSASGLLGTLTAVGSIGSMISGVIGNFQNAKMETTLNAIEHNTRYAQIGIDGGGEDLLYLTKASWGRLGDIHERLSAFMTSHAWRIHDVWGELVTMNARMAGGGMVASGAGGGAVQVNVYLDGKQISQGIVTDLKRRGITT